MIIARTLKTLAMAAFLLLLTFSSLSSLAAETVNQPSLGGVVSAGARRPKIGLALGGGGARGAAHVGVLKVLIDAGIPIDVIAGTSVGAVVGGLYAAGVPISELEQHFRDASLMKAFMTVPLYVRILAEPILFTPRLLGAHPYDGLYRGGKFQKFTAEISLKDSGRINIETFETPFGAVCTNVIDGKSYIIRKGNLGLALQASTAVPGLRKPVEIDGHLYCDGGLVCNLPTKPAREMGADFVIAVNIDERLDPVELNHFRVPGSVSSQALRIQLNNEDIAAQKDADFVIHPVMNGIRLVSRSKRDAEIGIEAGEKAAREALPELKRRLSELGVTFTK